MLAIASTSSLTVIDGTTLKKASSSLSSCSTLLFPPTATVWSPNNKCLFVASRGIHRYDVGSNSISNVFESLDGDEEGKGITSLTAKDKDTLVFSQGDKLHILDLLDSSGVPQISQTLESNKPGSRITSLALSNDGTLLAATSADSAVVYTLGNGSHTVLRGLPVSNEHGPSILTSQFHPHTRTRLLLGMRSMLVVYDTTRPSGPIKTVSLGDGDEIIAISCSPFSKTLAAVATRAGTLGLVDLDKEKGLFKSIPLRTTLTSLAFSAEGASVYVGTEDGRLLVLDLRALDKAPKSIVIADGERVECLSVQKKPTKESLPHAKPSTAPVTSTTSSSTTSRKPSTATSSSSASTTTTTTTRKPSMTIATVGKLKPKPNSSPAPAPGKRVVSTSASASTDSTALASPAGTRGATGAGASKAGTKSDARTKLKVFSPLRNSVAANANANGSLEKDDFSMQIESLSAMRKKDVTVKTPVKETAGRIRERTLLALSASKAKANAKTTAAIKSPSSATSAPKGKDGLAPLGRRTRTTSTSALSAVSAAASSSSPISASSKKGISPGKDVGVSKGQRTRTFSSASSVTTTTTATATAGGKKNSLSPRPPPAGAARPTRTRTVSSASSTTTTSASSGARARVGSNAAPPVPPVPAHVKQTITASSSSRTQPPDLSDIPVDDDGDVGAPEPVTPLPRKRFVGLGTPEGEGGERDNDDDEDEDVLRLPAAKAQDSKGKNGKGKSKARTVLFQEHSDNDDDEDDDARHDHDDDEGEKENLSLSMQISPRRPPSASAHMSASFHGNGSPMRNPQYNHLNHPSGTVPPSPNAQNFLRTLIRDALYDFQTEHRAEMMGLHLDLVRMGRGWRKEMGGLRELILQEGSAGGEREESTRAIEGGKGGREREIWELREENRRLREENERLRVGRGV